jgi:hypothetical protein
MIPQWVLSVGLGVVVTSCSVWVDAVKLEAADASDSGAVSGEAEAANDAHGTVLRGDASGPDSAAGAGPCLGGTTYASSTTASTPVNGYGFVELTVTAQNQVVALDTTLTVPAEPPATGTLFLLPGVQPATYSQNFDTLNNGILQPVLTWGPTCAPGSPATPYLSWWISGQYVNSYITSSSPNYAAYSGCHGGAGMDAQVGDNLDITMTLDGTSWLQTVTDTRTGQAVTYSIDMLGQGQNIAEFSIQEDHGAPVSDVTFTSTVLTFASAQPSSCQPVVRGTNDYFSAPQASSDGLHCCIAKVILRAQGVAATSPDMP